jgi:proline iminopeptidase
MWDNLGPVADSIDDLAMVFRYDQRACGRSSGESDYSMATAIADLDGLRAHFGVDRWMVGGHSFGASLALAYCLEHPERAQALIYVSGTGIDPGWHAAYRASRSARLGPERLRRFSELSEQIKRSAGEEKAAAESAYAELATSTDLADPGGAAQIVRTLWGDGLSVNREVNRILGADAARIIEAEAIRAQVAGLLTPTLIVHGEADPRPLWSVRALAELLPNARLVAIPEAGHYPWFEQPAAFRRILRDSLQNWTS